MVMDKYWKYIQKSREFYNSVNIDLTLDDLIEGHPRSFYGSKEVWEKTDEDRPQLFYILFPEATFDCTALDFGCGFGRHIVSWHKTMTKIDGCDCAIFSLDMCREHLKRHNINTKLYLIQDSLDSIPDNHYEIVYSLYVFQHIALRSLRNHYLKQIFNKLKPNGMFTGQFGTLGNFPRSTVDYFNEKIPEHADTEYTFVRNTSINNYEADLKDVGFENISNEVYDNDVEEWRYCQNDLFIRAYKPS